MHGFTSRGSLKALFMTSMAIKERLRAKDTVKLLLC